MVTAYVYVIQHESRPTEGYIGKTIDTKRRWMEHRKAARHGKSSPLYVWWRSLPSPPTFRVVESREFASRADADRWAIAREAELITVGRSLGYALHNANDGGYGGRNPAPSTRAKMSAAARNISDETRAKRSAAARGRKLGADTIAKMRARTATPETRAKLSAANRGKKYPGRKRISDEARAKLSAAQRGKKRNPHTAETRAKIADAARNISDETRAKRSAALRGQKRTPEQRAKISAAKQNISDETRAKMSAAARRRHAREVST